MVHPKQANKVCLNYNTSHKLTFIFICCHFDICVEFIVNQQVKHPQPMTEVTGKSVLKCRTTNIVTLFDISLFYAYNFFYIFSASSTQNCNPTCRCSFINYTKNHQGVQRRAAAIGTKPFLYSKASTEMVILKDLFQTV